MSNYWFAGQVLPDDPGYGWVREEDGSPAILWRPYLQVLGSALPLRTTFRSKEDCELFIRTEVLGASLDDQATDLRIV